MQKILNKYQGNLPRSVSLFLGNVDAAKLGVRRLEHQSDYNRVWPPLEIEPSTPEHQLMRRVVNEMKIRDPFVSIDLHNNTGLNPHHACINKLDYKFLHLATLFSRTVVYFLWPKGVQSMAFADICPAVTVECGRAGDAFGIDHAAQFIDACLHLDHLPEQPVQHNDINLYHIVATVKIPTDMSFGFDSAMADIKFVEELECYNFKELPAGTVLGYYDSNNVPYLHVVDEYGNKVERRFLSYEKGEIRLATSVMPSMLTLDDRAIRQDCLCYFMERYPLPG